MLLESIGAGLPAALAVALSPFPVIGVVLVLAGSHGRRNGALFAAGWVIGLLAVAALVVFLLGGADDPDSTSSTIADWGRVVVGGALIVLGVRKWLARPRPGDQVPVPQWTASLGDATAGRAFVLGAILSGANPKNVVLSSAATTSMIETGAQGSDLVIAVIVFVLVGSITVVGALVIRLFGGRSGLTVLEAVRRFMLDNSVVITVVILLILGAKVLGDGLIGLGRA